MKYEELRSFEYMVSNLVEEMGGFVPGFDTIYGLSISVAVRFDITYEKTRKIMETLQEMFDGEIKYHDLWVGGDIFITHSQAELRNINEEKALAAICGDVI